MAEDKNIVQEIISTLSEGVTVLKEENFEIAPISRIRIGDPMYFVNQSEGLEFTLDTEVPRNKYNGVMIQHIQEDWEFEGEPQPPIMYQRYIIYSVTLMDYVNAEKQGIVFDNLTVDKGELGCDSASFAVCIDNQRSIVIHDGTDGGYGDWTKYKDGSLIISLDVRQENDKIRKFLGLPNE